MTSSAWKVGAACTHGKFCRLHCEMKLVGIAHATGRTWLMRQSVSASEMRASQTELRAVIWSSIGGASRREYRISWPDHLAVLKNWLRVVFYISLAAACVPSEVDR